LLRNILFPFRFGDIILLFIVIVAFLSCYYTWCRKWMAGNPSLFACLPDFCTLTSGRECGKNKERFKGFEGRGADRRPHKSCGGKRPPFFTFAFDGTENVSGGQRSAKHKEQAPAKKEHTRKNV
jgi:hypothetical protein